MPTPEQIDKAETARATFLRIKAKREANKIHISKKKCKGFDHPASIGFSVGKYVRGFSNAIALGDAVRRVVVANARRLELRTPVKILVKDGKPLTEEGALLLKKANSHLPAPGTGN